MVVGFNNPWVSGFYVLGVGLLCLHLSHGVSAMFQSLGWKNKNCTPCLDCASRAIAIAIFAGYSAIPIAILLGFGKEALK
jgi:succinate dehydrogenase / fumarate reductase cytochrome b subunit